jgi:hypothetical protein
VHQVGYYTHTTGICLTIYTITHEHNNTVETSDDIFILIQFPYWRLTYYWVICLKQKTGFSENWNKRCYNYPNCEFFLEN